MPFDKSLKVECIAAYQSKIIEIEKWDEKRLTMMVESGIVGRITFKSQYNPNYPKSKDNDDFVKIGVKKNSNEISSSDSVATNEAPENQTDTKTKESTGNFLIESPYLNENQVNIIYSLVENGVYRELRKNAFDNRKSKLTRVKTIFRLLDLGGILGVYDCEILFKVCGLFDCHTSNTNLKEIIELIRLPGSLTQNFVSITRYVKEIIAYKGWNLTIYEFFVLIDVLNDRRSYPK